VGKPSVWTWLKRVVDHAAAISPSTRGGGTENGTGELLSSSLAGQKSGNSLGSPGDRERGQLVMGGLVVFVDCQRGT